MAIKFDHFDCVFQEITNEEVEYKNDIPDIKVKKYTATIDNDPLSNFVYFNPTYDGDSAYSVPFFLKAEDALDLAKKLTESASNLMENRRRIKKSEEFKKVFKELLDQDKVSAVNVRVRDRWTTDQKDQFYWHIVLSIRVTYSTDDGESKLIAEVMSSDIKTNENFFSDIKSELEKYNIKDLSIDEAGFKSIYNRMKEEWDNFWNHQKELQRIKIGKNTSRKEEVLADAQEMAETIMKKVKAEKERMKQEEEKKKI